MRFLLILLIVNAGVNSAFAFNLNGEWSNEESGRSVRFFEHENKFIGASNIRYITENGAFTGKKIEYFYQFEKAAKEINGQATHRGQLETFDGYYGCYFGNGAASVRWLNENQIELILPQINFKIVERVADKEYSELRPIYCRHYQHEYICGWRNQKVTDRRILSRECVTTAVHHVGVRFVRKN